MFVKSVIKRGLFLIILLWFLFIFSAFLISLTRIKFVEFKQTPLFEDREGNFLSEVSDSDKDIGFWEISGDIPVKVKQAFLLAEDKRFNKHFGVDILSVIRAIYTNSFQNTHHGASTIAMQICRIQNPAKRNIWNKSIEMFNAVFITIRYGREEILKHYLKIVPQGNRIHGVSYASRRYFQKPIEDLTWAEVSLLASLAKAPGRMNLFNYFGQNEASERAETVLNRLFIEGVIDKEALDLNLGQLKRLKMPYKEERPFYSIHFLLRAMEEYKHFSSIPITRPIRTTLDKSIQ